MGAPPQIEIGVLGWSDSLILMVLALVVFGPRRLPQIGRQIGKLMYEFRKASNDFKFQMEEELRSAEEADRRKKQEAERAALSAAQAIKAAETPSPESTGSPFREDVVYPPSAAVVEAQAEDIAPGIQPPSTGEPVAAARPGASSAEFASQPEPSNENGSVIENRIGSENRSAPNSPDTTVLDKAGSSPEALPAHVEETHAATEQAAQHG
jgi:sec-independent protein translocase protein TatB